LRMWSITAIVIPTIISNRHIAEIVDDTAVITSHIIFLLKKSWVGTFRAFPSQHAISIPRCRYTMCYTLRINYSMTSMARCPEEGNWLVYFVDSSIEVITPPVLVA
jgi:hypothetical protein